MPSSSEHTSLNERELRNAHKEFERLLSQQAKEPVWQQFFTEHPYILSRSLPFRLEPQDIIPLARPGRTEPDFIFYPKELSTLPFYGLIELKRPDSKIVTLTRAKVAILSRDAATAIQQAIFYDSSVKKSANILFLGNNSHIFVIMGMTSELQAKLDSSLREMILSNLPKNVQIIPYDYLLAIFEKTLPRKFHVLVPALDNKDKETTDKISLLKGIDEFELSLSVRSYVALKNANIRSLADLVQMREEEMIKIKNFGQKSINEIKEILEQMGLKLNMKIEKDKAKRRHNKQINLT